MSACSSGGGGDGGQGGDGPNPGDIVGGGADPSIAFSYPLNGQDDVYVKSQIAVAYRGAVDGDPGLTLAIDGNPVDTDVERDSNQANIFRLQVADSGNVERAGLEPNTDYSVQNADGDTLFSFTTRGYDGRPGEGAFSVAQLTRIGDRNVPFTAFNPIRARFSSPVDEGSVELCEANETLGENCTVSVTGPDGAVPGRLTVLGSDMTFDPSSDLGDGTPSSRDASDYDSSDLVGGQTYTVVFSGVQSAFGDTLDTSFNVTPVAISEGDSVDTVQPLTITPNGGDNGLNGQTANIANITSQLIGVNNQPASNAADRGGLLTRLAGTTAGGRYNNTFPALLPAGQQFDLTPINLKLNGAVQTPVQTGDIKARFINDADVYLAGNAPLAALEQPTLVLLRFDLGISTDVGMGDDPVKSLSNGVFNQTVMNIVAAGQAVPQANGDIKLTTLGSFPASVNRTGNAITDFELELTLPNPSSGTRVTVDGDQTAPRIIAQYPSACFYTFNTAAFDDNEASGVTTLSAPEADCIDVLSQRMVLSANDPDDPSATLDFSEPYTSSFPLNASPSIIFSEPMDPATLNSNITLTNVATGNAVATRMRSEGSSVVIDPVDPLTPATQYTITVRGGVTDLAGNGLTGNFPASTIVSDITFNTEPMVIPEDANGQPTDISQDKTQRPAVRQTAPFLTVLTPGIACPLDPSRGDFLSGGDVAGNCVDDTPHETPTTYTAPPIPGAQDTTVPASPTIDYSVFQQPANNPVSAYFSKPVQASTIQLADGCLIGGSGNTNSNATVAVQVMDGSGNCTGVVPGKLALLIQDDALTRGFTFQPADGFSPDGQRYWIVVCGSANTLDPNNAGPSSCSTGQTIIGQNGLALNTTPLQSTGTTVIGTDCGPDIRGVLPNCFGDFRGAGGPDIVMPFTGSAATNDFYAVQLALPETDTNGNGFFDNSTTGLINLPSPDDFPATAPGGQNTGEDRDRGDRAFNDTLGRERAQFANSAFVNTLKGLAPALGLGTPPPEAGYLSGGLPVKIRTLASDESCSNVTSVTFDDGTSVVGTTAPNNCVPVDLLPGGRVSITSLTGLLAPTGQVHLRFPYRREADGSSSGQPQTGYIVPKCSGTLDGEQYNYQPCFVANLELTVNANDGFAGTGGGESTAGLVILQQDIEVNAFGPVAFEQNGRLVISTKNANTFQIGAFLGGLGLPLPAETVPGGQALQLVGPAIHGGRAFPMR